MDESDDEDNGSHDGTNQHDRMLGLPGIPGEARLDMLTDDILERIKEQQEQGDEEDDSSAQRYEGDSDGDARRWW